MSESGWSETRVTTLSQLWLDGLSASQIAKQLGGVTRNAVIGKVHRLGLSGRAAASAPSRAPRTAAARPKPPRRIAMAAPAVRKPPVRLAAQDYAPEGPGLIGDMAKLGATPASGRSATPRALISASAAGRPTAAIAPRMNRRACGRGRPGGPTAIQS